jgi:exopolysaccharide biosynthesis protein
MYTLTLPATSADTSDEPDEPEEPTVTEPATEAPTEPPVEYPIITENSYLDENISITVTTLRRFGSNFHVAEIRLSSPQYLKTALAKDTYGLNIKEKTSAQARRVGAILAINGDYYGANEKGYVIRNGVLYRKSVRPTDDKRHKYFEDLAILWDGSFMPFDEKSITGSELLGMGAMQSLAFGPTLIKNGSITVDEKTEVGVSHPGGNPRTAICYVGEGHYLFVVAVGRTDASKGPTLLELATVLQELGAETAYNLDGGGSATMYFNGKLVNNPCTNWNEISEREVSDIVYIGY